MRRRGKDRSTIDVLVIEPNPQDARRFRELFDAADAPTRIHVVGDGDAARDFLYRRGEYGDAPRPSLVLLDPHLPRDSGYDLLSEIKTEPELRLIPVIVVSDANTDEDVVASYTHHANAYLPKPDDPDRCDRWFRALESFWLTTVRLPSVNTA